MLSLWPIGSDSIWAILSSRYVLRFYAPLQWYPLGSSDGMWVDAPSLVRADTLRESSPLPWSGRQHRRVGDARNPREVLISCWRFKDVFLAFQSVPRLLYLDDWSTLRHNCVSWSTCPSREVNGVNILDSLMRVCWVLDCRLLQGEFSFSSSCNCCWIYCWVSWVCCGGAYRLMIHLLGNLDYPRGLLLFVSYDFQLAAALCAL